MLNCSPSFLQVFSAQKLWFACSVTCSVSFSFSSSPTELLTIQPLLKTALRPVIYCRHSPNLGITSQRDKRPKYRSHAASATPFHTSLICNIFRHSPVTLGACIATVLPSIRAAGRLPSCVPVGPECATSRVLLESKDPCH